MCNPREVFKALPHVQSIWLTADGHFHLHSANGGERVDRDELENELGDPELDNLEDEDELNELNQGESDQNDLNEDELNEDEPEQIVPIEDVPESIEPETKVQRLHKKRAK